jgi:DAK2 domain fusion protein YloV
MGDSLVVVADDDIVKIHVHAEYPGEVMNHAMKFGDLTRIKIENMREQHTHILEGNEYVPAHGGQPAVDALQVADGAVQVADGALQAADTASQATAEGVAEGEYTPVYEEQAPSAPFGFVAVAMGQGISEIFTSLGVDVVISGGQTMNPSTEDIVNAIEQIPATTVYVFPNNSNIIMAARQAQDLVEDKEVIVIPSKTVPQCMAALVAFQENADVAANTEAMNKALAQVVSGQVTFAVRDTSIDGLAIKEGDHIGILDGKIVVSAPDLLAACRQLLDSMLADGGEIVTFLTGEEATDEQTEELIRYLADSHPHAEVEVHNGGQPLYSYLFAVE